MPIHYVVSKTGDEPIGLALADPSWYDGTQNVPIIERVARGSLAERVGLKPGDAVETINGVRVHNAAQAARALREASGHLEIGVMPRHEGLATLDEYNAVETKIDETIVAPIVRALSFKRRGSRRARSAPSSLASSPTGSVGAASTRSRASTVEENATLALAQLRAGAEGAYASARQLLERVSGADKLRAAVRIQAAARAFVARLHRLRALRAARTVQAHVRGRQGRQASELARLERAAATSMQAGWRRHVARGRAANERNRRAQVAARAAAKQTGGGGKGKGMSRSLSFKLRKGAPDSHRAPLGQLSPGAANPAPAPQSLAGKQGGAAKGKEGAQQQPKRRMLAFVRRRTAVAD